MMIWLYSLSFLAFIFAGAAFLYPQIASASTKREIKKLRLRIQHLQDTLDHYGIRMSNKIPDENKYYKRWHK